MMSSEAEAVDVSGSFEAGHAITSGPVGVCFTFHLYACGLDELANLRGRKKWCEAACERMRGAEVGGASKRA